MIYRGTYLAWGNSRSTSKVRALEESHEEQYDFVASLAA